MGDVVSSILDALVIEDLVQWMIEAEREMVLSRNEDENWESLDATVRYYIDDRIHDDCTEYVAANINIPQFAELLSVEESTLEAELVDALEDEVRDEIDKQLN